MIWDSRQPSGMMTFVYTRDDGLSSSTKANATFIEPMLLLRTEKLCKGLQ